MNPVHTSSRQIINRSYFDPAGPGTNHRRGVVEIGQGKRVRRCSTRWTEGTSWQGRNHGLFLCQNEEPTLFGIAPATILGRYHQPFLVTPITGIITVSWKRTSSWPSASPNCIAPHSRRSRCDFPIAKVDLCVRTLRCKIRAHP